MQSSLLRTRWAAIGAAVAVTLGAGGIGLVSATSPTGAVAYVPIEPCRAADTRPGDDNVGPRATPIAAAETHVVNSNDGQCSGDVPGTATGLQLNVTAVGASEGSFITIWASGARPLASSLNPTPGEPPVPNAVTTGITGAGDFNLYNNAGSVHVIVDIVGFYTDHNHDDRYYQQGETYTKAEVDTLLERMPFVVHATNQSENVNNTGESVLSISVTAPADGSVTVISSALVGITSTAGNQVRCYINDTPASDILYEQHWESAGSDGDRGSLSGNRVFAITEGATATYHLFCRHSGSGTTITVWDTALTAIFTPSP